MARYIAFTTQNAETLGWRVVYFGELGESRAHVDHIAAELVCRTQQDGPRAILIDTELENLVVLGETLARQRPEFRLAIREYWGLSVPRIRGTSEDT